MYDSVKELKSVINEKLDKSVDVVKTNLSAVRVGRASPALVKNIKVDCYGTFSPLEQIGRISVPQSNLLVIDIWDRGLIPAVETAIQKSDLNINPIVDGTMVKLPIPPLTEERRKELVKQASSIIEQGKVSIRHIRKLFFDDLKSMKKEKTIDEDSFNLESDKFEKIIKQYILNIDKVYESKASDIMKV